MTGSEISPLFIDLVFVEECLALESGYAHNQGCSKLASLLMIINMSQTLRIGAFLSTALLLACSQPSLKPQPESMTNPTILTNEAIFEEWSYNAKIPGAVRWVEEGALFTALETAPGYEDAELEKDQNGDDIKVYEEIVQYDPVTMNRTVVISLAQLTPEGTDKALVVDDYQWSEDKSKLLIYTNAEYVWRKKSRGDYWVLEIDSGQLRKLGGELSEPSQMMFGKFSPDASKFAYVWKDNIYVQDLESNEIVELTSDASDTIINGLFDWAYEEEFSILDGFRWSPDSQMIAYWQLDTHAAKDFLIINNTDTLYPVVTAIPYPKVGEENSAAKIGVVNAIGGNTTWIDLPGVAKDMYVPRMDWANGNENLLIQQFNRKQDTNNVWSANAQTGEIELLFSEKEETFIETVIAPKWLEAQDSFVWISERDGWRHLYSVSRDGKTFLELTPGEFDVTEMLSIDEANGWVYYIASPENVAQRYLHRAPLDGSGQLERVTPDKFAGTNGYKLSADSSWAVHSHSSFMQPPVYSLLSLPDHKIHHVFEDNAELAAKIGELGLSAPDFYSVEARDGLRLDGYKLLPLNFDPQQKYPLINFVYGEPAGQTVVDQWGGARSVWHMMMAQRGFIISSVDNRGTRAPRGRDWRRSIYGAVGILGSRDQADSLAEICQRWQYIDCDRVGIWGHSGGGSMTLNMMFRYPAEYHVGISIAPVPDQRLYDSIYQERYSGLLSEFSDAYDEASAINFASQLQGKLLLMHGTGDDNVHYQGTERLINEFIRHNKQFDFMSYPNRRHGIREGEGTALHMHSLMTNYFSEHL